MEIEKKFLIKDMPKNLDNYIKKEIQQGYLSLEDPVLRVRKSNDNYFLTYKSVYGIPKKKTSHALVANEVEFPISKKAYNHLLGKADYNVIEKTRYLIPLDGDLTAELDIFYGILEELVIVEVEFPDEDDAKNFVAPEWFGQEVTFDERFKNNYLVTIDDISELSL